MTTTDILGYALCSDGTFATIFANGLTDGTTEAEIYCFDIGGNNRSIGDLLNGKRLERLALQPSDGSILTRVTLYDADGSILMRITGCERTSNQLYGMDARKLSIPLRKGAKLKGYTTD